MSIPQHCPVTPGGRFGITAWCVDVLDRREMVEGGEQVGLLVG